MAGFATIQFDVNEDMLAKSRSSIEKNLAIMVEKGRISSEQRQQALGLIHFTAKTENCIADLIIEAIIENLDAKTALFQKLVPINSSKTIFATNTSSISVSAIAKGCGEEKRMAGMHFFNPAPLMKLVEVIHTAQTDDTVTETLVAVAKQMGKTPVICSDSPGFIVNRVARHYYLEAMELVEKYGADIATTDAVMEAAGFKMGPFKLMDLIGMDINYSVSNIVWEALGKPERLKPSTMQRQKVEAGELGRKTGKGFYKY